MVLYREIPRTAAFAWSPGSDLPIIATGTKAGVLDNEFSNKSALELWDLNLTPGQGNGEPSVIASETVDDRFHDLDWRSRDESKGLIAGALQSGIVKVWDATKLLSSGNDAAVYSSPAHDHAMKRVQFSPFLNNVIASTDVGGGLHITDLEAQKMTPIAMGTAGSLDALDWNKKTSAVLATGDSLGTISVIKTDTGNTVLSIKKAGGSMTNSITSIAWDPEWTTSLAAGVLVDGQYKILIYDMRNPTTPVRELSGHTSPVNSLSWCQRDPDLLLSSSQDYQTCWNPRTGNQLVQFSSDSSIRGVFETRFNTHIPSLFASASFEKTVSVVSLQNTNTDTNTANVQSQVAADDDFFNNFKPAPKSNTFSITQAPKWLQRPVGAKFGFGGKLFVFSRSKSNQARSNLQILDCPIDSSIKEMSQKFEDSLAEKDLNNLLSERVEEAESEEDKADWAVIQALVSGDIRTKIPEYLGFPAGKKPSTASTAPEAEQKSTPLIEEDDAAFFDNFTRMNISDSKPKRAASPFKIHASSASPADAEITKALISGSFEDALKICQEEDRWTDAFMIAICGGEKHIQQVKEAYLAKNPPTSSYMRLVSSISSDNIQEIVESADLADWKDIMATICTFASQSEFPQLAEALGDRLQAQSSKTPSVRKDATFCYLVSSKLEKVLTNWLSELKEREEQDTKKNDSDDLFSIHARFLQKFIEKVTVFRKATNFTESDRDAPSGWKLSALYAKYLEYADVMASVGKVDIAEKYLNLLPSKFSDVETARARVKPQAESHTTRGLASSRTPGSSSHTSSAPRGFPYQQLHTPPQPASEAAPSAYTPANTMPAYGARGLTNQTFGQPSAGRYDPGPTAPSSQVHSPPPKSQPSAPGPATSQWNDLPDFLATVPKRPASAASHAKIVHPNSAPTPPPPKTSGPIPPPPKTTTPMSGQPISRPPSVTSHLYAPPTGGPPRASSPYDHQPSVPGPPRASYTQRPPSGQTGAPSRYAPVVQSSPASSTVKPPPAAPPANPYAALAQSAPAVPPNPYASIASIPRPTGVPSAAPMPPPPPKGPPKGGIRGPPKGPLPGATVSTPPPRGSSAQTSSDYTPTQSSPAVSASLGSNIAHNEISQAYESIKSMWAKVASRHANNPTESRTMQTAVDSLGTSISRGTLNPQTQDLLIRVNRLLPDYKMAKDTCKDGMKTVPPNEGIIMATVGKILVGMVSLSRET